MIKTITYIRSSKHTLKYSNIQKLTVIQEFIDSYRTITQNIINDIWNNGYKDHQSEFNIKSKLFNLPSNLDNQYLKQFSHSLFTQRMLQACGTQASAMIRGTVEKNKKRYYILDKLIQENKDTTKLLQSIEDNPIDIPDASFIYPRLDNRFYDIKEDNTKKFPSFINLKILNKQIKIPLVEHKVSKKWKEKGKLLNSILLSDKYIVFSYEIEKQEDIENKTKIVGVDQGINTVLTLSDNQTTPENNHGYNLNKILHILSIRKKGSKGFKRTQEHRKNYINWTINQLNFSNIKEIKLEKLYQMRKGVNKGKFLSAFTYTMINRKLELLSETEGFKITEVNNVFRSLRCNQCGWTQKSNRKGKVFICKQCLYTDDADINASFNLELDKLLSDQNRFLKLHHKGFYWNPIDEDKESIVSYSTIKTN